MVEAERQPGWSRLVTNGPLLILVATAIGGGSGYLLTILAGARLGAVEYAPFALFWSSLYLVITALTGVQQELSRAARPRGTARPRPVARNVALVGSVAIALIALLTSPLWSPAVFPGQGLALVAPLAFGVGSYVVTAVTAGVLYGLRLWPLIAAMIAVDGVLRIVLTGTALLITDDTRILAWAVVTPFLLTPVLLWLVMRHRLVGQFELDAGYRRLTSNVARTLLGSAATGVLISGFPALLGATSPGVPPQELAALAFSVNLARAPLVIVVLSLQSYFLVSFQRSRALGRTLARLLLAAAGAAVILGGVAWSAGPFLLEWAFGSDFVVDGPLLGIVVASGGLVGMLCITGAAVLARSRHNLYSAGWLVAAVVAVLVLLSPLDFDTRAALALTAGPALGLGVHLVGLAVPGRVLAEGGADLA